jgi:hypothetical protein
MMRKRKEDSMKLSITQLETLMALAMPGAMAIWQRNRGFMLDGRCRTVTIKILSAMGFVSISLPLGQEATITPAGRDYLRGIHLAPKLKD